MVDRERLVIGRRGRPTRQDRDRILAGHQSNHQTEKNVTALRTAAVRTCKVVSQAVKDYCMFRALRLAVSDEADAPMSPAAIAAGIPRSRELLDAEQKATD